MKIKELLYLAEVGLAVKPPAPSVGQASSTGGQKFTTPTGTKHFANPKNPNQTAKPTQDELRAQIRANQEAKLKSSSLANLPFAKANANKPISQDDMIGRYAMPGVPTPASLAKKPPAQPKPETDYQATGKAMATAADAAIAAGQSPQDAAKAAYNAPKVKIQPSGPTSTGGAPTAPTLGSPTAAKKDSQEAGRELMRNLAKTSITPTATQNKVPQGGFFSGIAQGFKKGMGMDTDRSIASNLASSGLEKLGLGSVANTVGTKTSPTTKMSPSPTSIPQMPKPGQMIPDPVTGKGSIKVMPNPSGKGVKLDTTKSLGYPIIIDPKDLK